MIAVYTTDRAWRTALAEALRAHGLEVRVASRQAELAKCLTHAGIRLIITGPEAAREREAVQTITALAAQLAATPGVYATTPGDTIDEIVRRALALLPP